MRLTTLLVIGFILALALTDLALAAWWFGLTMLDFYVLLAVMVFGLLKAAMTAIASVLASAAWSVP